MAAHGQGSCVHWMNTWLAVPILSCHALTSASRVAISLRWSICSAKIWKHMKKECPRWQYKCPHCQEAGEYQERITEHLNECPMIEVPCPKYGCKVHIKRCNLSVHREECPFEKVPCKYSTIGCKEEVKRKDLAEHEGDAKHHLQLAVDTVHQQQIAISKSS